MIEPKTLCVLGKSYTTELHPQQATLVFFPDLTADGFQS